MAFYLVRARPKENLLAELQGRLRRKEFVQLRPFGRALTAALMEARWDDSRGEAVWEEEDYCVPPLAQERAAVLDRYFDGLTVEAVARGEGWARIARLPPLWAADAEGA